VVCDDRPSDRLARMLNAKRAELFAVCGREFGERLEEDALTSQTRRSRSATVRSRCSVRRRARAPRDEAARAPADREALSRLRRGHLWLCEDATPSSRKNGSRSLFATRCVKCERRREIDAKRSKRRDEGFRAAF